MHVIKILEGTILEKKNWKRRYWLYTVPSSGKFIYQLSPNASIGIANGVGAGPTCIGNFYHSMNDTERAALLPYAKKIIELLQTNGELQ